MNMEPEVPIKKLETMVKLDAVRRVGSVPRRQRARTACDTPCEPGCLLQRPDCTCERLHPRLSWNARLSVLPVFVYACVQVHKCAACKHERQKEQ